jgi:hypothetical protein
MAAVAVGGLAAHSCTARPTGGGGLLFGGGFFPSCTCESCAHCWTPDSAGRTTEKEVAAAVAENKRIKNLPLGADKIILRTFKISLDWYKKSAPKIGNATLAFRKEISKRRPPACRV